MIAPGLCDRRLTFYQAEQVGEAGFSRVVYTESGTYWGRIDDLTNTQTVAGDPQAHVDQRVRARATVSSSVPVPTQGYVRVGSDGPLYAIRSTITLRQLRAQRVELEYIDPTASATFVGVEPKTVLDGIHLIDE